LTHILTHIYVLVEKARSTLKHLASGNIYFGIEAFF